MKKSVNQEEEEEEEDEEDEDDYDNEQTKRFSFMLTFLHCLRLIPTVFFGQ